MRVIVARSAGFCWGVERAVERARRLVGERGRPVYTDGPLIHNRQMMDQLRAEGIVEASDPASLNASPLLVRAHGIPPERRRWLTRLPLDLVDATCPDVARIQGLIRKHARQGSNIVIFGDAGHAEVSGLLGFAEERGFVVGNIDDVAALPELGRVCVVSQSTQFPASYQRVADAVCGRFRDVDILDTICKSTKSRQEELTVLADDVDVFVVVGGRHSANTMRLAELASSLKPTLRIETAADIVADQMNAYAVAGLTAGASTPAFVINDVKRALEETGGGKETRP